MVVIISLSEDITVYIPFVYETVKIGSVTVIRLHSYLIKRNSSTIKACYYQDLNYFKTSDFIAKRQIKLCPKYEVLSDGVITHKFLSRRRGNRLH